MTKGQNYNKIEISEDLFHKSKFKANVTTDITDIKYAVEAEVQISR